MTKTIKEVVEIFLVENGFDGLADGDGCGCVLDSLMPCDKPSPGCYPAYRNPCDKTCGNDFCDFHMDMFKA